MNRRGFLKLSGVAALALAGGTALTMSRAGARYRRLLPMGARPTVLSEKELAVLCALCDRLLPDLDPSAREARVAERVDRELGFHGKKLQTDVKNAIFLVEHGGWVHLQPSRFTARSADAQDAWLERMAVGSSLERQAFAGLREVVMFFYYCDERTWAKIHYDGPLVSIPSPPEADSALIPEDGAKGLMDPALRDRVLEWNAVNHDYDERVDAVVIGTGCGGAVVAKELARAGKSVLMLERGGLFLMDRGDFDQREDDMTARIDGGRGADNSDDGQLMLAYGHCVGGASVHYWADTWRTPKDRLELWASKFGVEGHSYDELLPHFERIERDLNVHPAEDERLNKMNRLFETGAKKLGFTVERVLQARKGCIGSGYCMQGCAYDAKQSQLVTHIPAALMAGARIFADCQVDAVEVEGGRAVGVRASFLDRRTNRPSGHKLRVRAKVVVVSAGGYNSAPLLLRSKIPNPSGQLGKNLQVNPCAQTFALFDEEVVMWRGLPAGVGVVSERLARHDAAGKYLGGGYLLHPNQIPPAGLSVLLPGWGRSHRALMEQLHHIGSCIAWVDDVGSGEVALDDEGRPVWSYHMTPGDDLLLRDALRVEARVLLAAGAREVILPEGTRVHDERELQRVDGIEIGPGSVVFPAPHPAGMCRMGKDPSKSVVDSNGRVHAVQNLFVCDPSVFPTAVSVDPSETIMAFSYVAAGKLLQAWPV